MEAKDFSALRISLASPEQIRSWSYGEVTKPETINYRRLRPEMDGLFCERIFGPTRDWQCYCGKYKNIRYRGIICDKCGVEVTRSSVRRERMGHIELAAPVAHVWYTRRVPSYLGLLLDVSRRNLDRVLYFAQYVVTTVDEDARGKAIARIEKELQAKEEELSGAIEDQMTALRDNRDQIAADFESKAKAIRDHFDAELARLSDEVMSEAQSAQTSVENLLGQAAAADIKLDSASAVVVAKGESITNDHISKIQTLVNEHLSALQLEIEAVAQEEIGKISGEIDSANVDVDSSMDEQLQELDEKLKNLRASADKQIEELDKLQSLVAYSETATKTRNEQKKDSPFISESKYRELKSKFGNVFQAAMGAEAFYEILSNINMTKMADMLWDEVRNARSKQVRRKATKRLRVVESLRSSRTTVMDKDETKQENEPGGNRPEWMILTVLPVIPPDLRPMVQLDGGRFATSDLNDLYRRVINRNNRLKHLLDLGAPDVIVRNEKRMLQEAVDSLIDNSQRGKALSRRGRRELKSLSDMLKGKKGRFRRNLLGKRVDYSGRSVIVIGPKLKLHQCGLPKTMALELYRPFVISRLVAYNYASNVKGAKRIIERERPEVWEVLEEVIRERPVLLNRAPTLHRLGIQAFEPLLVEGKAIQIHPLVCSAFNADFDGDQMAVHVPLSEQAVKEARDLMLSTRNLLKPSDGAPIVGPSKDMVLGNYYLTMDPTVEIVALRSRADEFRTESALYAGDHKVGIAFRSNGYYYAQFRRVPNSELFLDETAPDENGRPQVVKSAVDLTVGALLSGEVDCMLANAYEMRKYLRANQLEGQLEITNLHERRVVVDMDEVEYLYRIGLVNLHTPILLGNVFDELSPQEEPEICTVGRAIFNRILPDEMRFVQETLGKRGLQDLVARCYQVIGGERTTEVVDAIKNFGFHYATISGTTIAVSDLAIPDERTRIMQDADEVVSRADRDFRRGLMTEEERYQITIDEWNRAKDTLQEQIQDNLDPYGPIAIMALSGSTKGGFGPITQLAGMRGLMADPSGRIIDLPIRSHFREGLNALEYFISTHGARKGLADTALRTADAGYLTRRLVDVAQDMIVNRWDCNTSRGLVIRRDDEVAGQSMGERIVGRCSAQDLYHPKTGELLLSRNEIIDENVVSKVDDDLPTWIPEYTQTNRWAQDVYDPESRQKLAERDKAIGENLDDAVGRIAHQVLSSLTKVLRFQIGHYVEGDVFDPKSGKRLAVAEKRIKKDGANFAKRIKSSVRDVLEPRVEYYARRDVYDPKAGMVLAKADNCIKEDGASFISQIRSTLQILLNFREGHYVKHDVYDPTTGAVLAEADKCIEEDGISFAKRFNSSLQTVLEFDDGHYVNQDVYDPKTGAVLATASKCIDEDGQIFAERVNSTVKDILESHNISNGISELPNSESSEDTEGEPPDDNLLPSSISDSEDRVERIAQHDLFDPNTGSQLLKQGDQIEDQLQILDRFALEVYIGQFAKHDVYDPKSGSLLVTYGDLIESQLQSLDRFKPEVVLGHFAQHDVYDPESGIQLVEKGNLIDDQLQSLDQYEPELYEKHFAMQDVYDPNSGDLLISEDELIVEQLQPLHQFKLTVHIGRFAKHDAYHPDSGNRLAKKEDLITRSIDEPLPVRIRSLLTYELKGNSEHTTEIQWYYPRTAQKLEKTLEGNWKYVFRSTSNDFEEGFHSSNPELQIIDPSVRVLEEYLKDINEIEVRSPLTCDLIHGVCALCYGRDLGTGEMVNIGSAVGIIAAQSIGEPGTQLTLRTFHSGGTAEVRDITSGLPRVEELFEARRVPKGQAVTTGIAGVLRLTEREDGARIATVIDEVLESAEYDVPEGWDLVAKDGKDIKKGAVIARNGDDDEIVADLAGRVHIEGAKVYIRFQDDETEELEIPANARLRKNIFDGMQVEAGEQLTEGSKNPHHILRVLGANATQLYLLSEIQEVYRSQGVNIADKHFETVIRKMMCKVQITRSGDSELLPGELIDQLKLLEINERLIAEDAEPCSGTPVLLGITKAALSTESYLSAASFQHTIKVLAGAAIEGQVDPLHGLKENVIIGKLIPAGTGFHAYHDREVIAPAVTLEAQGALDLDEVGDQDDFENMLSEL